MRFKYRLKMIRGAIGNRLNGERCRHSTWLKINTGIFRRFHQNNIKIL